jgi:hypothetical protein
VDRNTRVASTHVYWIIKSILIENENENNYIIVKAAKVLRYIKVICKVRRLGGENGQFRHNREGIKCVTRNEILQNEMIGTQTSFSTNFGSILSFIPSFLSPERLHCCYIYFHYQPKKNLINFFLPCQFLHHAIMPLAMGWYMLRITGM